MAATPSSPFHPRWPGRGAVCRLILPVLAALTAFGDHPQLHAQPAVLPGLRPGQRRDERDLARLLVATVHPSEEAGTLLQRFQEGISRQDWKLAVDCLQRMIELGGEHVLASGPGLHEAARRVAQRRLAELPEEGIRTYRLLHDGEAAALLARATADHDEDQLRRLIDRYVATSVGPKAVIIYADWLMDQGRFAEAAARLHWLRSLGLDRELPAWILPSRWAICLTRLGQRERALSLLAAASQQESSTPHGPAGGTRPDGGAERLAAVRAWVEGWQPAASVETTEDWPVSWGDPGRSRRQPEVIPSFPPDQSWRIPLEPPSATGDTAGTARVIEQEQLLPTATMVTDGRRLLTRDGPRLLALDARTFQPRWRSPDFSGDANNPSAQRGAAIIMPGAPGVSRGQSPAFMRAFHDAVGAAITIAFGLALTVDWPEGPPQDHPGTVFGPGVVLEGRTGLTTAVPNRIIACRLTDGRLAWATDTAGGEGLLAGVQFFAAPLPLKDRLIAPGRIGDDFYLLVLRPATGELDRHVYLCGVGGVPMSPLYPREPTAADGLIFVPTHCGLLIAVDAEDFSIAWAAQYEPTVNRAPPGWLPTPPLPAADGILLTPEDADNLFFFERSNGGLRWSVPRDRMRYLLAADDRRVWLAGDEVAALDLRDGRKLWQRKTGTPRGRGILAGRQLLLPTSAGLEVFDAETGEPRPTIAVPPEEPLGNLWAFDGALYILSAGWVAKYPDLGAGYQRALAEHRARPTDPDAALRLAILEICRHEPAAALAALEQIPSTYEATDPAGYADAVHLQVVAMLECVSSGQARGEQARHLLERARQLARTPVDALNSALALGDFYRDQGMKAEACIQYFSLVMEDGGDALTEEQPGFERRAGVRANERLSQVAGTLTDAERREFMLHAGRVLEEARSAEDTSRLGRLADCPALGEAADQAGLALAAAWTRQWQYEAAETVLRRVLDRAVTPSIRAEAMARLAAIAALPGELHLPLEASQWLDRLVGETAEQPIPAEILTEGLWDENAAPATPPPVRSLPSADFAGRLKQRLDRSVLETHRSALDAPEIDACIREVRLNTVPGGRPLVFRGPPREPQVGKRLMLVGDDNLELFLLGDGRRLWPALLRLPGEMIVDAEIDRTTQFQTTAGAVIRPPEWEGLRTSRGYSIAGRGVAQGQTLVLNTRAGLHAVGLMTGRRLWARPFQPPAAPGREPAASDAWLSIEDGLVAAIQAGGRLEVAPLEAGDQLLWVRHQPQKSWNWVRARGRHVVAMDAGLQQVDIFDLRSGIPRGTCAFRQTPEKVNVALFEEVICGPIDLDTAAAHELAAPGIQRWRMAMPAPLCQIFRPRSDLAAITDRAGRLVVLDAATGRQMLSVRVPACADGVVDGLWTEDVLYVYGFQKRPWSPPAGDPAEPAQPVSPQLQETASRAELERRWALAAIRISDGRILWERGGLPARTYLSADLFAAARGVIPLAVFVPAATGGAFAGQEENPRARPVHQVELTLLEKATGQTRGETIVAEVPLEAAAATILDVQVWPDMIEVVAGSTSLKFTCPMVRKTVSTRPGT